MAIKVSNTTVIDDSRNITNIGTLNVGTGGTVITTTGIGSVGIGTTNPTQNLDINGGLRLTGALYDGSNLKGNSGQILKSTGSAVQWIDANTTNVGSANSIAITSDNTNLSRYLTFVSSTSNNNVVYADSDLVYNPSSNSLGIGTTNPLQKLHVFGNLLVAAGSSTGQHITQNAYELNNGTLSWEGTAGQLFSITNNLTSGSIFSVNDVSGIPSIDVDASGTISLGAYGGNIGVGTTNAISKLTVQGNVLVSGIVTATSFRGDGSQLTGVTGTQVVSQPFTSTPVYPILASNAGVSSVGIATTNPNSLVFIPSTGNLGIGSTTPTSKLTVQGDGNFSGIVTANSFRGDGSLLTGVTAVSADSYLFNTGITSSFSAALVGIGSTIFTFPATAGKKYVILSVNCSNVSTGNTEVNVIGAFDFNTTGQRSYFAYNIPIPTGTALEVMKQPQVLNPSDRIVMRSTNFSRVGTDSIVEVYVSYQEKTTTSYFGLGISTTGFATTDVTGIYTSSTYPSVIQSIRLVNVTDSGGYPVSVQITNGLTTTRLVDNLIVPKYASVEVLDAPKRIETNSVIQLQLDQAYTISAQVSGSQITS